jgi:hypothetical protein
MFPNLKNALVLLYSTATFTSSEGRDAFKSVKAFLGKIKVAGVSDFVSSLRYLTSL